jgi:hypothetical protein
MAGWWKRIQNTLRRWTERPEKPPKPTWIVPLPAVVREPRPRIPEATWLEAQAPGPLLTYLGEDASPRKLRLFGCACCRPLLSLYREQWALEGLALSEQLVDRLTTEGALAEGHERIFWGPDHAPHTGHLAQARDLAMVAVSSLTEARDLFDAPRVAEEAAHALAARHAVQDGDAVEFVARERARQADLVRCLFRNPSRPLPPDPPWLASPDVRALALGIYEDHAFDCLPVLADALEEAGCDNADVLAHCREAKVHARGCWVVDAVLGKE